MRADGQPVTCNIQPATLKTLLGFHFAKGGALP
jgi:hypothetical protein